jgi:hypothetical protein
MDIAILCPQLYPGGNCGPDFERAEHRRGQTVESNFFSLTGKGAGSNPLPMPRKLRLEFPGAMYHVMSRGDFYGLTPPLIAGLCHRCFAGKEGQ